MALPLGIPVAPSPPDATRWLVDELSKPEYQRARPTIVDVVGQTLADWFSRLFAGEGQAPPLLLLAVLLGIAVVIVVVALIVNGRPRRDRRAGTAFELFGAEERRGAARLRADAAAAARRGDWEHAIADAYRAVARGLGEREVVAVAPGTTARGFATRASAAFPAEAAALDAAAAAFDGVRYLGRSGSEAAYRAIAALDARLEAARPVHEDADVPA